MDGGRACFWPKRGGGGFPGRPRGIDMGRGGAGRPGVFRRSSTDGEEEPEDVSMRKHVCTCRCGYTSHSTTRCESTLEDSHNAAMIMYIDDLPTFRYSAKYI